MAANQKIASAFMKRKEQIKSWKGSDTDLEPVLSKRERSRVKFQDGCVFLAACSSGDVAEVEKLLMKQVSIDINTTNVDGLTALHQACIDNNLEMVQFLVKNGADVNACDNEGWTPLHATASCGFTDIARYLINHQANVAAVNNDGDLPMDIADSTHVENLLQQEMDKQGIDAETVRCEEEQRMLEDVNQWLRDMSVKEVQHPKTGATSLHVAAAKGYITVINLLLEAGVDINAEDYDGWTPFYAAVYWGQEEACRILAKNKCDMMHKNKAGHTAFDLAEKDMCRLLEKLKEQQTSINNEQEKNPDIILSSAHTGQRRNMTSHVSSDENIVEQTSEEDKKVLTERMDDSIHNSILLKTSDRQDMHKDYHNDKSRWLSHQIQFHESPENQLPNNRFITAAATFESNVKSGDRNTITMSPSSYSTSVSTINNTASSAFKRSHELPKRDEETETQRKVRAKHARQTRRSTQGVSLEDLEKAEESLNQDKGSTDTASRSSSQRSFLTRTASSEVPATFGGTREDISVTSGYRLWSSEDKTDLSDVVSSRSSFRRSREDKDQNSVTSGTDVTSTYKPRSQRIISTEMEGKKSTSAGQGLLLSSYLSSDTQSDLVSNRTDEELKNAGASEKKEERKETSAIRARRQRRERRPTGIYLDGEDAETSQESKADEDENDDNIVSDQSPSTNSYHTQIVDSTKCINTDYKKKYEEEKVEHERLRKELDETKNKLLEAKSELDKTMKQKENWRSSDRDKRALERKLSEMEEEFKKLEALKTDNQRLRDENSALIRVISMLSKK